jgi:hypothetical protein
MSELEHDAAGGLAGGEMKYRHVLHAVSERPWAIRPATLAVIVDLLSYRARGHRLSQDEVNERIADGQQKHAAAAARPPPAAPVQSRCCRCSV